MRWPWQRRPAAPARHAVPRQVARWAEPALPPAVPEPVGNGVLLGFSDGSQVRLDDTSPTAVALRAVADVLAQRDRACGDGR